MLDAAYVLGVVVPEKRMRTVLRVQWHVGFQASAGSGGRRRFVCKSFLELIVAIDVAMDVGHFVYEHLTTLLAL